MNSSKPRSTMDRTPLQWHIQQCHTEQGQETQCLMPHRHISGFESIAISRWCRENVGSEDAQWGRTVKHGWWFADPARHTQFLLVFQRSQPEVSEFPKGTKIRFLEHQPQPFIMWHHISPEVDS